MSKIIKNEEEYRTSLTEMERLMEINPDAGTPEADQLELLGFLIETYEKSAFPIGRPDSVEAIEFRMEQQNLAPRDLIPFLGSRSKVSEILSRKRSLTLSQVRALHDGLGIPAEVLLKSSATVPDTDVVDETSWNDYPLKIMVERGWIDGTMGSLRTFFREGNAAWNPVLCRKTEYVRSARQMDSFSLTAWTMRVVSEANKMKGLSKYRTGSVTLDFMRTLAKKSRNEHGPSQACDFLREAGIPLIVEPHLPQTYLDGAAIIILDDRPVIGLTVRHDRLDNFWFTLMHELAHLSLHSSLGHVEFFDDLDLESTADPREKEADELAGEALIPRLAWEHSPARSSCMPQAAESLAAKLQIHPSIVAGRMRHHWRAYRLFNNLVGHHKVRSEFTGITWPL